MNKDIVYLDDRIEMSDEIESLGNHLERCISSTGNVAYILKSALTSDGDYEYQDGIIVLVPKHTILIVDCRNDIESEDFDIFYDEIIEDLGYLSDKFAYKKILGRPRIWKNLIQKVSLVDLINDDNNMNEFRLRRQDERKVELLISLFIGSINDPIRIGAEIPESDLLKVKKNIILFDCMQSRFIYERSDKKIVTIQGLAGTGKTELLLHKLQKLYIKDDECRIAFTCFNKVLANDMVSRVTGFFNFLHVDKQIEWNKRLWVFRSWGSGSDKNSGLYSYICNYYDIPFIRYSQNHNFGEVCQKAIFQLKEKGEVSPCFDYLLVDESQDFSQPFFELCQMVTSKQVIKAGDIFQNIFDMSFDGSVDCDYLLNRCYRTDPRTLMVAHAIGMGLYEHPVVRWLQDEEWRACGYSYTYDRNYISLTRAPIRRFQDMSSHVKNIELFSVDEENVISKIIDIIKEVYSLYEDVEADDIAVVLTTRLNASYEMMSQISHALEVAFDTGVTLGHVSKTRKKGTFFVSNINNIKGLEFPFVICVQPYEITRNIYQRNAIYMALTRSFLTSYFLVSNTNNNTFYNTYKKAAEQITELGKIYVERPSMEEIDAQTEKIRIETQNAKKSMEDIVDEECVKRNIDNYYRIRNRLVNMVTMTLEDYSDPPEEVIREATIDAIEIISKNRGVNHGY